MGNTVCLHSRYNKIQGERILLLILHSSLCSLFPKKWQDKERLETASQQSLPSGYNLKCCFNSFIIYLLCLLAKYLTPPLHMISSLVDSMHDLTSKLQEVTWHTGQSNINSASTLVSRTPAAHTSWLTVTKVGHPIQHIQVLPCCLLLLLH